MKRPLPLLAALLALLAAGFALRAEDRDPAQRSAVEVRAAAPAPVRWTAPDETFAVDVPARWSVDHGAAATVLQRPDRRGTVVVRRGERLEQSPQSLARGLERRLRARLGAIRPLGTRSLDAGGLLYTFIRPGADTVQSVAVIPARRATYTLDVVVSGADEDAAREVGAMVRSFTPAA
jgi:hypothetical protein